MAYQRRIDRLHPGCLIFLLDQSGSMGEPMPGHQSTSKAQSLADIINDLLLTIVRRCVKEPGAPPRHYYDVGVIGYGEEAVARFGGTLAGRQLASVEEVAQAVLRTEDRDGLRVPVWFDPVAEYRTAMCSAMNLAGQVASGWLQNHPGSFPPIVLNISDGKPTDGDPTVWAQRLRALGNDDGNLLLFNINISSSARQPISFPATDQDLPDDYSKLMFELSSPLPDLMRKRAEELGAPTEPGARGFVCNANIDAVIRALEIGTSLDQLEEY